MIDSLFEYQVSGSRWLATRKTAFLADEMGLGKSAQVVAAADLIDAKRILVLCPASARANWVREFEKFSDRKRAANIVVSKKKISTPELTVCSYDLAKELLDADPFDLLVLDECHYLKSKEAKRTKAVLGKHGLVRRASRVWALSGTPAPNHPGELYPLLKTFGLTEFNYDEFVRRYCTYFENAFGLQITGARIERIPELKGVLAKTMLRRKKEDVLKDLPPIRFTDEVVEAGEVDLWDTAFKTYLLPDTTDKLRAKLIAEEELAEKAVEVAVDLQASGKITSRGVQTLEAMAQSVSTLRRFVGLQKVEPIANMVAEELMLGAYDKIVIFAVHKDVIKQLERRLKKFKPVVVYGATSSEFRQAHIDRFQTDPNCCIFIGNIQAAGTSITLTAAHTILFAEQDWVPGNNAQAAMRCHRIGQKNPVVVRFVGLANSMDSKVSSVLRRKTADLVRIFGDCELPETYADVNSQKHR